ncbi:MAG: hypothetical protein ABIL02_01605 [candidate division WOR-3 bacterium]
MKCWANNTLDYNKIQIIIYYRLGVRILSYLILSYNPAISQLLRYFNLEFEKDNFGFFNAAFIRFV